MGAWMFLLPLVFVSPLILSHSPYRRSEEAAASPGSRAREALDILEPRYTQGEVDHYESEAPRQARGSHPSGTS